MNGAPSIPVKTGEPMWGRGGRSRRGRPWWRSSRRRTEPSLEQALRLSHTDGAEAVRRRRL